TSPTHESHALQRLYVAPAPAQNQAPIVTHPVMVTSPVDIQGAQLHFIQLMQQQRCDHVNQGYLPLGLQQTCNSLPIAECPSLMVTNTPGGYKPPACILNQPEGTCRHQ
ncbi:uncharacterized protein BO88DRAFT_344922, partial [Aspergillus vadensis CBS 113365]